MTKRRLLFFLLATISLPACSNTFRRTEDLAKTPEMLSALREVIANLKTYTGEDSTEHSERFFDPKGLPKIIQDLHPEFMSFEGTCIEMRLEYQYRYFACSQGTSLKTGGAFESFVKSFGKPKQEGLWFFVAPPKKHAPTQACSRRKMRAADGHSLGAVSATRVAVG